jgi:flagellar biosynthetic protein FliQ
MDIDYILYLARHTMETALMVAAPLLLVCMFTGIIVSLFQAVTSLRDMTLTMVPKLLAISITALIFGNWMMQVIMKFTIEIFQQVQNYGQQ